MNPKDHYGWIAARYESERFGCRCGAILNDVELEIAEGMITPGGKVLDAGAGTGRFSKAAAKIAGSVVAVDGARNMLAIAAERVRDSEVPSKISLVVGDAEFLPFDAATFDTVLSVKLLSHYGDIGRYLSEMARVLKPEGRLILDVPHNLARAFRKMVLKSSIRSSPDYFHPLSEIGGMLRDRSIYLVRRRTYSMLPISLVHRFLCRRDMVASTSLLRLLIGSQRGFLCFVEGIKRQ